MKVLEIKKMHKKLLRKNKNSKNFYTSEKLLQKEKQTLLIMFIRATNENKISEEIRFDANWHDPTWVDPSGIEPT